MAWIIPTILILVLFSALGGAVEVAYIWYMRIKQRRRRRAADRRIIAQAQAAGVWDKYPIVLGGRALELKVWQDFKIMREPGEPDAHLRRRYMAMTDNKPASPPSPKKERHDEIDALMYAALKIPPEILYGRSKKDTQDKGESANE